MGRYLVVVVGSARNGAGVEVMQVCVGRWWDRDRCGGHVWMTGHASACGQVGVDRYREEKG